MKTNRKHILITWILLFCFAAGQWAVWSHQHSFQQNFVSHNSHHLPQKTVISENCRLCDVMHHNAMAVFSPVHFALLTVISYAYKTVKYQFTGIALILSAGRSPPMA